MEGPYFNEAFSTQSLTLCSSDMLISFVSFRISSFDRDNGVINEYDVRKCMFSSGNVTEKLRVAKFPCQDQVIVDLYAGETRRVESRQTAVNKSIKTNESSNCTHSV